MRAKRGPAELHDTVQLDIYPGQTGRFECNHRPETLKDDVNIFFYLDHNGM